MSACLRGLSSANASRPPNLQQGIVVDRPTNALLVLKTGTFAELGAEPGGPKAFGCRPALVLNASSSAAPRRWLSYCCCPRLDRVDRFANFLEAPADLQQVAALAKGQTIGRPLVGDQALGELEKRLGRTQRPGKRCRPPSQKNSPKQLKLVNGKVSP